MNELRANLIYLEAKIKENNNNKEDSIFENVLKRVEDQMPK